MGSEIRRRQSCSCLWHPSRRGNEMSRVLIAGVALAMAVMTGPSADAGHRRSCCCSTNSMPARVAGTIRDRAVATTCRWRVAQVRRSRHRRDLRWRSGSGQTIRRFSEEPNTPAAPVSSGTTYAAGPSYSPQFNAPTVGTYIPPNPSSSPARNPVERRLHPGGGWMRN